MLATNWQELYEDAIFEINPDRLTSCIEEAEQAIAQRVLTKEVLQKAVESYKAWSVYKSDEFPPITPKNP